MKRINFGTKKPTTITVSIEFEGTEEELGKLQKLLRAALKDAGTPVPKAARSEDIAEDIANNLVWLGEAANGRRPDFGVMSAEEVIEKVVAKAVELKAAVKAEQNEDVDEEELLDIDEEEEEDEDGEELDEEEVVAPPPRPAKAEAKPAPKAEAKNPLAANKKVKLHPGK